MCVVCSYLSILVCMFKWDNLNCHMHWCNYFLPFVTFCTYHGASSVTNADVVCGEAVDVAEEVEVAPAHNQAHNGIDELLRASAYAPDFNEDSPARMEDLE